ncbi:MAG TPA: hypothetical protein VIB00_03655, partial [Pyrinomonadaceae bacterium]
MKNHESMQQLEELFHEALELKPQERGAFMARIRESDPELGNAVPSLIAAHEQSDVLLDSPASEVAGEF